MSEIIVDQLYKRLSQKEFQDTIHGDLFYNYFIVPYDTAKEYETRERIAHYCDYLSRPVNYIHPLHIDLFEELCNYLDNKPFGKKNPSYLKYLFEKEKQNRESSDGVAKTLTTQAQSDGFIRHIHDKIKVHQASHTEGTTPYIFVSGIGNMFPYLRLSVFLNKYEEFNATHKYKLFVFYPGEPKNNSFKLFDQFDDQHVYRAALILDFRNI